MSEIKNGGLDQYGAELFEQRYGKVQKLNGIGGERVNRSLCRVTLRKHRSQLSGSNLQSASSKSQPHNWSVCDVSSTNYPPAARRQTDQHHGNSLTIRSNERIAR